MGPSGAPTELLVVFITGATVQTNTYLYQIVFELTKPSNILKLINRRKRNTITREKDVTEKIISSILSYKENRIGNAR